MAKVKKIVGIEVVEAGHNPDIDSDFRTDIRALVYDHVADIYGHDNVSHIITFGQLAAKSAFKTMCTIYQIPFASANKVADLVPGPVEGKDCTLRDIFDPESDRYDEAADFRNATSGEEWKKIIEGARGIEGRYKSTGVHACGVIMSSKPLSSRMPMTIGKKDGLPVTQWTYPECESLGFLKFDFLGLDNVDLVQNTVEYISKNGKTPPNMVEIAKGPKDDAKTYKVFQRGDTQGIFQFGSDMVRDYCRLMKPTEFDDLVATTALCRPGPMGANSHTIYANRRNGREEVSPIHPAFKNSPLETILEKTQGIIAYQEQVMKIANEIAGMTLQEGDEFRSAMGKKKKAVMEAMRPKFFSGAMAKGYPEDAVEVLWNTLAFFAQYGFNKSHSVGYAMVAYQVAYLKANYPVEFMAALIAQNAGKKDKLLQFLQEARNMGLKIGAADINRSTLKVAPDFTQESGFDIVYGLGGISSVSEGVAEIILQEREAHGPYTSVQDLINRCSPLGVSNRKVYENLALAGAFETFGASRKSVIENLSSLLGDAKVKANKGSSLFDIFEGVSAEEEVDLTSSEEYPYVEKLKREANVLGLYLTGHPLDRLGAGLSTAGVTTIKHLISQNRTTRALLAVAVTSVEKKYARNGGKSVKLTLDDNSGYLVANLNRNLIKGMDKKTAQVNIENLYKKGEKEFSPELFNVAVDEEFLPLEELEVNDVYLMEVSFRPAMGDAPHGARVNSLRKLNLSPEGKLPVRVRYQAKAEAKEAMGKKLQTMAQKLSKTSPGPYALVYSVFTQEEAEGRRKGRAYFEELRRLAKITPGTTSPHVKKTTTASSDLFQTSKEVPEAAHNLRELPPLDSFLERYTLSEADLAEYLTYEDSGYTVEKSPQVEQFLASKFGAERMDLGVYNKSLLESN